MQQPIQAARPARWLAPLLLLFGSTFTVVAWVLVALYLHQSCGWMAVLAALASALMLRLGRMPRSGLRPLTAVLATLTVILLVNWTVAAIQIGMAMGLNPWDSALKLGADYALTLAGLANHTADRLWMALALALAAFTAR